MEATFKDKKPEMGGCEGHCSCDSKKIKGGGLIGLLESIIPKIFELSHGKDNSDTSSNFDFLQDDDFDQKDKVVEKFNNDLGGVKGIIKIIKIKKPENADKFASMLTELYAIRKAEKLGKLRQTFAHVNNAKMDKRVAEAQVKAIGLLEDLLSDTDSDKEFEKLASAKNAVLKGTKLSFDTASYRVKDVFASYVTQPNVRLAYTSQSTQDGEPFMLCPKARYQIGAAKPIEISKCRDNCIDSRTTTEGKTVCAYAEWLNVADNQNSANARLEVHRNPVNDENLLTLKQGERTKKATYNEKNYEQRIEEEYKRDDNPEEALEKRLDDASEAELGHHGEPKESVQEQLEKKEKTPEPQKRQAAKADKIESDSDDTMGEQISDTHEDEFGDETIEEMLADEWSGLDDSELDDVMEVLLRQIKKTDKKKGK